ncbi:hypothetical protein E6O75_ATG07854 [Venturia nashicola]|uniref:Uncharacterized protein n=1 Tax=Venturia nashicola TaxID=86259 RepID=A0A4Z1NN09_9PEZI|nr:hypothetical protein E6O75_ATG07854 [Venturia nashicola]
MNWPADPDTEDNAFFKFLLGYFLHGISILSKVKSTSKCYPQVAYRQWMIFDMRRCYSLGELPRERTDIERKKEKKLH